MEHFLTVKVEGDVFEGNGALHVIMIHRVGTVRNMRAAVVQLHDLGGAGGEALGIVDQVAQLAHGIGKRPAQLGKDGQFTGSNFPQNDEVSAQKNGDHRHGIGQQLDEGVEAQPHFVDGQLAVPEGGVALLKGFFLELFPGKGAYDAITGNIFLRGGVHFAQPLAHGDEQRAYLAGIHLGNQHEDGRYHR